MDLTLSFEQLKLQVASIRPRRPIQRVMFAIIDDASERVPLLEYIQNWALPEETLLIWVINEEEEDGQEEDGETSLLAEVFQEHIRHFASVHDRRMFIVSADGKFNDIIAHFDRLFDTAIPFYTFSERVRSVVSMRQSYHLSLTVDPHALLKQLLRPDQRVELDQTLEMLKPVFRSIHDSPQINASNFEAMFSLSYLSFSPLLVFDELIRIGVLVPKGSCFALNVAPDASPPPKRSSKDSKLIDQVINWYACDQITQSRPKSEVCTSLHQLNTFLGENGIKGCEHTVIHENAVFASSPETKTYRVKLFVLDWVFVSEEHETEHAALKSVVQLAYSYVASFIDQAAMYGCRNVQDFLNVGIPVLDGEVKKPDKNAVGILHEYAQRSKQDLVIKYEEKDGQFKARVEMYGKAWQSIMWGTKKETKLDAASILLRDLASKLLYKQYLQFTIEDLK